ncbi:MAG: hypothetical protein AB8F74_17390, partial [Saprospiraceae bacterium]
MRLSLLTIFFLTSISFASYAQQSCMDFNALDGLYGPEGQNSTPGWYDVFHTEGPITLSAQGFMHPGGSIDGSAQLSAGVNQYSGAFVFADGSYLKVNPTSTMIYQFPTSDTVSFNFIDWGDGNINFAVNNEPVSIVANLMDLPVAVAPGVSLFVTHQSAGTGSQGTVTLTGVINKVIIGGDDLGIDNFCQNTNLSQQCSIEDITLSAQPCNMGEFMTDIDFVYADTGSLGFTVSANGTDFGTFAYTDLPITVGPLAGDNTTDWTFVVADVEKAFCTNNENLGVVNCPLCSIDFFITEAVECTSDSTYSAYIEFFVSNASSAGYDLFVDNTLFGTFPYAQIPYTGDIPSTNAVTQTITICDSGTTCCESFIINALDCAPQDCNISDLTASTSSCDNGLFDVTLNFNVDNPADTVFNVNGNGTNYGFFNYVDLPITISGLSGDNSTTYEFFVSDATESSCTAGVNIGTVDCLLPCDLSQLFVDSLLCQTDSTYGLMLDFSYGGNTTSSFNVNFNDNFYGNFGYNELPLNLNNLVVSNDTVFLQVCDEANVDCCIDIMYISPNCS